MSSRPGTSILSKRGLTPFGSRVVVRAPKNKAHMAYVCQAGHTVSSMLNRYDFDTRTGTETKYGEIVWYSYEYEYSYRTSRNASDSRTPSIYSVGPVYKYQYSYGGRSSSFHRTSTTFLAPLKSRILDE
eukprot:scaffold342742_cov31-Prasinocladus_malaysianus.AAC.1